MATPSKARSENVAGNFYVDSTCIDCDTCRWMAPDTFREAGGQSAVHRQPDSGEGIKKALEALVACPTASIGTRAKSPELAAVIGSFPIPLDGPVFLCGFHSEASFGAASYFVKRPGGNILVDSPRFAAPLVKRLEELGGVKHLFLTHRDDVADHAQYRARFGCERILHEADLEPDTRGVEIVLKGTEPFRLAEDALILPVPGHTRGHSVLLLGEKYLFTGDHLAYSPGRGHLVGFRDACWYSWSEQIASMERLAGYRFEWVLPGHGRRYHAPASEMQAQMQTCLEWMKKK